MKSVISAKKIPVWTSVCLAVFVVVAAQASTTYTMYCTSYGWLDNSPPGAAIAYPQIHSTAGGVGTYANPVTFATDENELKPGTIVYVAYLKKYFIMEDDCTECDSDWASGKRHIDLWAGGNGSSGTALLNCEDNLTETAPVIVSPANNLTVDTTPLFNSSTKQCYIGGSGGGGGGFSGNYEIECVASSLSVNVKGASKSNSAAVIQWPFGDGANALWNLIATDSGYYRVMNVNSGLALVVQGASKSNGAEIIQYTYNASGNDEWKPNQNSDGSYTFVNRLSGLVLDDPGSSTSEGTQFDQWGSNNGSNQHFYLISQ
jgi:hypothetical protein